MVCVQTITDKRRTGSLARVVRDPYDGMRLRQKVVRVAHQATRVAPHLLALRCAQLNQIVMSQYANRSAVRQQVIAALSQIMRLPLAAARRAADMRTFQFGVLRPVDRGSIGDFALHVQCPWRIEAPDGIVTGRLDLWEPVEDNAAFDENWDYEKFPNLQDARLAQWLAQNEQSLVVRSIDADEYGSAAIFLGRAFVLRLFPAGTRGEEWRLFRPNTDAPHFVVSVGAVERDDEPGA